GCAFPGSTFQRRIGTGTGIRPHLFLTRVLWRAKNGSAKGVSGTTKPGETEAGTAGMQPSPRDNLVGAHASRCGQRGRSNSNLALPPPSHFSPHRTNRPPHALKILFRFSRALKHPLVGAAPPCALPGFGGQRFPTRRSVGSRHQTGTIFPAECGPVQLGWREIGPADMDVPKDFIPGAGAALVYQGLPLPRHLYERVNDQPLHLEINYSLTLLNSNTYNIPALGGDTLVPAVGRCRTQMDDDGDDVLLRCIQAGGESNCVAFFLEHAPSGRRNPIRFGCWPNYSPYSAQYTPDSLTRFEGAAPFRDLSGLAKYPVDAAKLPESRVVLRIYQPQEHFTRRLVIPEIHLSDWESLEHDRAV